MLNLLDDPIHEWQPVAADLARDAVTNWLARFSDQRFSLIDAVSFELMRRAGLKHAFACALPGGRVRAADLMREPGANVPVSIRIDCSGVSPY